MSENLSSAQYLGLKTYANTYRPPIKGMDGIFRIKWRDVPYLNAVDLLLQKQFHIGDIIFTEHEGARRIWDIRWSGGQSLQVLIHPGDPGRPSESLAWGPGPIMDGISSIRIVCPHNKEHLQFFSR